MVEGSNDPCRTGTRALPDIKVYVDHGCRYATLYPAVRTDVEERGRVVNPSNRPVQAHRNGPCTWRLSNPASALCRYNYSVERGITINPGSHYDVS